ncbi:MAG: protein kinase, partial [Myxococcota bacterium]
MPSLPTLPIELRPADPSLPRSTARATSALERAAKMVADSSCQTVVDVLHGRALDHYARGLREYLLRRVGREALDAAWAHLRALVALQPSASLVAAPGVRAHLFRLAFAVAETRRQPSSDLPRMLEALSPAALEVLELRFVRELRPRELCCVLDEPLEAVMERLASATALAKDALGEGDGFRQRLLTAFAIDLEPEAVQERPPLTVGTVLSGRYRVMLRVGAGAFGDVYRAEDTEVPGHIVALKLLHQPSYSSESRQHALRELRHIASVFHPSVVQFKDHGWHEGRLWFVMPWYEGETLSARMKHGPLSREEAHAIFVPLARGLRAMHAAGLRHQDVKPDNVLLAELPAEGGVLPVLLDLGVAATEAEMLVAGTPTYFAPEIAAQFAGDYSADGEVIERPAVDARSDVFSLALTLRNALEPDGEEDVRSGATEAFIEGRALNPVPAPRARHLRDLRADFGRWLALDAEARPTSEAFIAELDALLRPKQKRLQRRRRLRWTLPILLLAAGAFALGVHHYEALQAQSGALLEATRANLAGVARDHAGLRAEHDALALSRDALDGQVHAQSEALASARREGRSLAERLMQRDRALEASVRQLEELSSAHRAERLEAQRTREAAEQRSARVASAHAAEQERAAALLADAERRAAATQRRAEALEVRLSQSARALSELEASVAAERAAAAGHAEARRELERALEVQIE